MLYYWQPLIFYKKECIMYKTIQREAILNLLKQNEKHFSADEVFMILKNKVPQISLATVYRNLELLAKDGKISMVQSLCSRKLFEFNTSKHFHIRCPKCNNTIDIPYASLSDIDKILLEISKEFNCKSYHLEFISECDSCTAK